MVLNLFLFCCKNALFELGLAPAGQASRQWHGRPLRWLYLAGGAGHMSDLHKTHDMSDLDQQLPGHGVPETQAITRHAFIQ